MHEDKIDICFLTGNAKAIKTIKIIFKWITMIEGKISNLRKITHYITY